MQTPDGDELGFLRSFDPEASATEPPTYPTGDARFTADIGDAMQFASKSAAFATWWTQSETVPHRPDGKANRPLTIFTMSIVDL
jgi:hypothetical protein